MLPDTLSASACPSIITPHLPTSPPPSTLLPLPRFLARMLSCPRARKVASFPHRLQTFGDINSTSPQGPEVSWQCPVFCSDSSVVSDSCDRDTVDSYKQDHVTVIRQVITSITLTVYNITTSTGLLILKRASDSCKKWNLCQIKSKQGGLTTNPQRSQGLFYDRCPAGCGDQDVYLFICVFCHLF